MQSTKYKLLEFFIIFIIIPVSFAIDFPIWIKMAIGLVGFTYIVYILLKIQNNKFKIAKDLQWKGFLKQTLIKLFIIAVITSLYVYFTNTSNLFIVVKTNPKLWVIILFIYSFLSVYPQELIYRTFYFQRYKALFLLIFSVLMFKNTLVLVLTFFGGLLFAFTFKKTKSTLLVSIEHA